MEKRSRDQSKYPLMLTKMHNTVNVTCEVISQSKSQITFSCLKLTVKLLEKGVKYVQR